MKSQASDSSIRIQSSNIQLGDALIAHAREKIEASTMKLFGQTTEADVHFRREGEATACSVRMKVGRLKPWAAEMTHHNPYRAFNNAFDKVAAQMRRTKAEIREEHGTRLDKELGIRVAPRPEIRAVLIPNDDIADLTTMDGADDYVRASIQAAKQNKHAIESAQDILTLQDRPMKNAAE
jgi:ribosomal subunit interface protein